MATKTKKRPAKKVTKKAAVRRRITPRGPAKASTNGSTRSVPAGAGKFDAKQKPLDVMPDIDEKIPALEDACQRYFAGVDKVQSGKQDVTDAKEEIGDLLKEHDLPCYIKNGRKFFFEPSREEIRVKKVKQQ